VRGILAFVKRSRGRRDAGRAYGRVTGVFCGSHADSWACSRAAVRGMVLALAVLLVGCMRAKPPRSISAPPVPPMAQAQASPVALSVAPMVVSTSIPTLVPTVTPLPTPAETLSPTLAPGTEITVTIQPKDTLYSLACRFHTTVPTIQARNGLGQSTDIRVGQTLIIPAGSRPPCRVARVHIVRRGETVYSISRDYGVSPQVLVQVNALTDPNQLFVGQRLVIP